MSAGNTIFGRMISIQFPDSKPLIRKQGGREQVFCPVRKSWVALTPEEWVRQNLILYLTQVMSYPITLIAVEKQIRLGELNRRFDILVYDRNAEPFLVLECKEMDVPLTPEVLNQVLRYNIPIRSPFIVISNGTHTIGYAVSDAGVTALSSFPPYQ